MLKTYLCKDFEIMNSKLLLKVRIHSPVKRILHFLTCEKFQPYEKIQCSYNRESIEQRKSMRAHKIKGWTLLGNILVQCNFCNLFKPIPILEKKSLKMKKM